MNDPYNPTDEEIKRWAYSREMYPCEDWDLIVADCPIESGRAAMMFDIAADMACPNRESFLHFLSVMVGSVVRFADRDGLDPARLGILRPLIDKALLSCDEKMIDWGRRAQAVIENPSTFRYADWYG